MRKHSYGYRPDLQDHRDYLYAGKPGLLPASVDLRAGMPPVVDQGQLGSCTANAWAGALGFLEIKDGLKFTAFSRLFIYYDERVIEGTVKSDAGAALRDGAKTLAKSGVCPESVWPYTLTRFASKPSAKAYAAASAHVISTYSRVNGQTAIKTCLASGFPVVVGFTVYESFESPAVAKTGVMPMPQTGEKVLGGHAVVVCGYDTATNRWTVRNSWGKSWGLAGYFTMPMEYPLSDCWTAQRGTGM